eukprot:scaffold34965_cov76-Cyclotella_meneghiniana.AAC.12
MVEDIFDQWLAGMERRKIPHQIGHGYICGVSGVAKCWLNKVAFPFLLVPSITFAQIPLYKSKGILHMMEKVTGIAGIPVIIKGELQMMHISRFRLPIGPVFKI